MRDFLNAILQFIGSSSLTDTEYATVTITATEYNQATYDTLTAIISARETVSTAQTRLNAYFTAKGVNITLANTANSNILIGGECGN